MKRTIALLLFALIALTILGGSIMSFTGCVGFVLRDDERTIDTPAIPIAVDTSSVETIYDSLKTVDEIQAILDKGLTLAAISGTATIEDGTLAWHSVILTFYLRHNSWGNDGGQISFATVNVNLNNMTIEQIENYRGTAKSANSGVFAPLEAEQKQISDFDAMIGTLISNTDAETFKFEITNIGNQDGLFITLDEDRSRLLWTDGSWE